MSSVKNPADKKLLSLKHDRRNAYGENAKASRRLIPLRKQQSSQAARAAVAQVPQKQNGLVENLDLEKAESLVTTSTIKSKRDRFKKRPDASLIKVLVTKKTDLPTWSRSIDLQLPSPAIPKLRRAIQPKKPL
jgi:hypothetical protein